MFIQKKGEDRINVIKGLADVENTLKPGIYKAEFSVGFSGKLETIDLKNYNPYEKLKPIKFGVYNQIQTLINDFISDSMNDIYKLMGSIKKIGIGLYSKPGTGKTALCGQIMNEYVKSHNAIGIIINQQVNPLYITKLIDIIREGLEEDNLIFILIDEFEKVYGDKYSSSELLSYLDGVDSRNNVVTLTTANDIRDLPDTLIERPGRFEYFFKVDIENFETMKSIVESLIPEEYEKSIDSKELTERILNESKNKKTNRLGLKKSNIENPTIDDIRIYIRNELFKIKTKNDIERFLDEIV